MAAPGIVSDVSGPEGLEMRPVGGSWSGLLFENQFTAYPLTFTWTFTVDFDEVDTDAGSIAPSLTLEWIPAGEPGWTAMVGQRFVGRAFADPIEASFYLFEHYRFERVELHVDAQSDRLLTVVVSGVFSVDAAVIRG